MLRGGLEGAAAFEGIAASELELGAAQDHAAMAGGAVDHRLNSGRRARGPRERNRAYHFLMEGFGKVLILGM